MRMHRHPAAIALLSALLFGVSTPLAKMLLGQTSPWMLAGLLYLGCGIGLAVYRGFQCVLRLPVAEAPLRTGDLPWLGLVVLAGGVVGPLLLMFGLAVISASTGALLLNLEGLATMGIAWLVFRENVDRRIFVGACAILAGAAVLASDPSTLGRASGWGEAAVAGACVAWGIDNNLTRKLSAADPVQIAMIKGLVAGSVNVALSMAQGERLPGPDILLAAGMVGMVGYGISLVLFISALRHLGAARTSAYFSTSPFLGATLAILALGDPVTWQLGTAATFMAFGVYLHVFERHEHLHEHGVLVHEHRHIHDEHHQHVHGPDDPAGEPHTHLHRHERLLHRHPHYPDIHHRHSH